MRYLALLLLAHLAFPVLAAANVPPPDPEPEPRKPNGFNLVVERIRPNQTVTLKVPAAALKGQREFGARGAFGGGAGTVIAGLAIAMGVVAGGIWLLQRRRRLPVMAKTSLAAAVVAIVGLSAIPLAVADLLPPPRRPRVTNDVKTLVEVDARGDSVVLKVTDAQWKKLNAQFTASRRSQVGNAGAGDTRSAPPVESAPSPR